MTGPPLWDDDEPADHYERFMQRSRDSDLRLRVVPDDSEREAIRAEGKSHRETKPESGPPLVKLGAADIFAPLPPVPWLVEGLDFCPGPPHLVAGYGFAGKTVALQALAVATVTGRRAWGTFAVRRGRVLHLDFEQGKRLTLERYQRLARFGMLTPDELDGLDVVCLPPLYLDSPGAESMLVRECQGYALVIVDSLRASSPRVDENSSEVRTVLDMLHRVSDKTDATAVVVHHARKPSGERDARGGARMGIRGSGALYDACASVFVMEAQKGEPVRVIHEKARTSGRLADDFLLRIEDVEVDGEIRGGLSVTASAAEPAAIGSSSLQLDGVRKRIATLFSDKPIWPSKTAIVETVGGKRQSVWAALDLMLEAGEIRLEGRRLLAGTVGVR